MSNNTSKGAYINVFSPLLFVLTFTTITALHYGSSTLRLSLTETADTLCFCACLHVRAPATSCSGKFPSSLLKDVSLRFWMRISPQALEDLVHGSHRIYSLMSHSRASVPGSDSWSDRPVFDHHKGPIRQGPHADTKHVAKVSKASNGSACFCKPFLL